MDKKIQRVPGRLENNDRATEIRQLTDELRKAQTKYTLAKLYEKVLDYGSELVLREPKCVDNPEATELLEDIEKKDHEKWDSSELDDPLLGEPSSLIDHKQHNPEETLRKNAQFLLDSSRSLPDYSPALLHCMENAFERTDFQAVIEFAMQHDVNLREQRTTFERESDQGKTKKQIQNEVDEVKKRLSVSYNWGTLLDEILSEKPLEKTPLGHCISAMKALSGELTYDARSEAKRSLAQAVAMLEGSGMDAVLTNSQDQVYLGDELF